MAANAVPEAAGTTPLTIYLQPRPNSHPFNERECLLDEKLLKVGRSVAKARPSTSNLIFDCKVLSRNHAVMWAADGQVFLRDTKSSNGTFVNNLRLSGTGEESQEKALKDGDVIQFGVDVMENQRQRVTHGCIIALFTDPSARAPTPPPEMVPGIKLSDVIELQQILTDARHTQVAVENRLGSVQFDLEQTALALQTEGKAFIKEEHLLSRLDTLENQLKFYTQDQGTTEMQATLKQLEDDKHRCAVKAKESLQSMLQEKMEVIKKYSNLQLDYDQSEQECDRWRTLYEEAQEERKKLAETWDERSQEMYQLQFELKVLRQQHANLEEEHMPIKLQHDDAVKKLDQASVELVTALQESKFANDRLCSLQEQMELLHERNESLQELNDAASEQVRLRNIEIQELHAQVNEMEERHKALEKDLADRTEAFSGPHARYTTFVRDDTLTNALPQSKNVSVTRTTQVDPMETLTQTSLNREVHAVEEGRNATNAASQHSAVAGQRVPTSANSETPSQSSKDVHRSVQPLAAEDMKASLRSILVAAFLSLLITIYYSLPTGTA
ncbi:sarcolemmal membrane-associated protein-like [Sycon ciliatum]|uniref:sarcolemmal membrane-associated protein-like n=1 Tax=Sycon ciliatum TaxID=27933 RepID=UPI0031F7025D